jgi:hypothetical protein
MAGFAEKNTHVDNHAETSPQGKSEDSMKA